MLRLQLPVLLSFAFLRCLIGQLAGFCAARFAPQRLKTLCNPVKLATARILSFLHAFLIGLAAWYTLLSYDSWSVKSMAKEPDASLVCTEYNNTRVQGLLCASALLALFTNSDAFTLGLSLAIFKGVADGSTTTPVLSAITWAASTGRHDTNPKAFFACLFSCAILFSTWCYSDERNQFRSHGVTIAASFAALFLSARACTAALRRIARGLRRCMQYASSMREAVWRQVLRQVLRRSVKPEGHTA